MNFHLMISNKTKILFSFAFLVEEDEQELLFRLDNYVKSSEAFVSKLANLCPTTTNNDSGYSSQQTGRDGQIDNPKIQALFSNERFPFFDKTLIDPAQFNRDYTVGVVTLSNEHHQNIHRQSPKMGNVTLYPTPEGYVLGPHSITVDQRNRTPKKLATSPTRSINQTDSQYFACVNIPPAALSSNRPPYSSPERANAVRVQGPVILRQDTVVNSEKVSPISVKIRSLKYPQLEKGTMTDSDSIRREIDRTADEIDYLRTKLDRQPTDFVDHNQLNLFRDVLDEQRRGKFPEAFFGFFQAIFNKKKSFFFLSQSEKNFNEFEIVIKISLQPVETPT